MSRFPRLRRRPDHFSSQHQRAQVAAAERLDGPIGLAESSWLDEHLASCPACAAVAASYEADRLALRGLRADLPEPPRDLWARTAAAIEQQAGHRGRRTAPSTARPRRAPLGALSGVAVIAVVVGASVVSNGIGPAAADPVDGDAATGLMRDLGSADPGGAGGTEGAGRSGAAIAALPTPFSVGAGEVQWVRAQADGTLAYNVADVDEVCPAEAKEGCATLSEDAGSRIQIDADPESIIASPDDTTAIVVSRDAAGGQELTVLDLDDQPQGTDAPPATTSPAATPDATAAPTDAASPSTSPAPASTKSPDPIAQSPAPDATSEPTPTDAPPATDTPEPTAGETSTSAAPTSASPSEAPTTTPEAASEPPISPASPEPTVAAQLAIASDIQVVGESAAFSSDGSWFAFTATSAGDVGGPNVYLWKVGEEQAQPLTDDGRSVFASWEDGSLIISRPVADGGDQPTAATNTLVDPDTGDERDGPDTWRPVLDPTRTRAVAWDGTILADEDGMWHPAEGRLVVGGWAANATASEDAQVLAEAPIGDFDVRWDETGTWFAVWIADRADPGIGQLDLYRVDPVTGTVDQPEGAPDGVRALPGFSLGQGRLAWATPPGQEGEGSRLQIVAWNDDGVGTVESAPGEDVVVIR